MEHYGSMHFTAKDLFEAVLVKSVQLSGCTLDEEPVEELVSTILEETRAAARLAGMEIDQLQHINVHQIVQDITCKEQKFSFNSCTPVRRRFTCLHIPYDRDDVTFVPGVDIYAGLRDFLMSRNLRMYRTTDRQFAASFFSESSVLRKALDLKALVGEGVMEKTLIICSTGIAGCTTETTSFSIYGHADNLHIQPIKVRFYAHDPSEVVMRPGSSYDVDKFTYHWKNSEQGVEISSAFTCIKPAVVRATFRAEIEFSTAQQCNPNAFFSISSFGILPFIHTQTDSSTWTTESFTVTINCKQGCWFHPKEKLKIEISVEQVDEFIDSLRLFTRIKAKLGRTEDLKQLADDANREATDAIAAVQMESLMNRLRSLGFDPNNAAETGILPTSAELEAAINNLRNLSFLDPEIIKNSRLEAILEAGKQKAKWFDKHPTYTSLAGSPADHNGILGHMFEELTAGKIKYEASLRGIELERIAGDGKGLITGNLPTPEYADLVFRDQNGNYYGYQLKFSDSADNIQKLTKKFYDTHGGNVQQHKYPPGLKLEDIKIIVPDGISADSVKVKIKDPSGNEITKTVTPSSDIQLGDLKLKSPSKSETSEHLKNNFEEVKKLTKVFDNWTEKLRNINTQGKKVASMGKEIEKLTKKIEDYTRKGTMRGEDKTKMEANIKSMENKVEQLKQDLQAEQNTLAQYENEAKEAEQFLKDRNQPRSLKKTILIQCAIAALVDGVVSLVQSLDRNIRAFKRGEVTGGQLALNVVKDTAYSVAIGQVVSLPFTLSFYGLQKLATSEATMLATTASVTAKVLGPCLIALAVGYEAYSIHGLYKRKEITNGEKNKLLGRMVVRNASMVGSSVGIAFMIGTGPLGLTLGAASTIAIALGDYFFGEKVFDAIFGSDLESTHEELRRATIDKAYCLFDLSEHCTDAELKEAYREAVRKYHPDKTTDERLKARNTEIARAVITAFALLKDERKMS